MQQKHQAALLRLRPTPTRHGQIYGYAPETANGAVKTADTEVDDTGREFRSVVGRCCHNFSQCVKCAVANCGHFWSSYAVDAVGADVAVSGLVCRLRGGLSQGRMTTSMLHPGLL